MDKEFHCQPPKMMRLAMFFLGYRHRLLNFDQSYFMVNMQCFFTISVDKHMGTLSYRTIYLNLSNSSNRFQVRTWHAL